MHACMYNMYVCIRWQLVACGAGSLSGIERTVWRGEVMQNSLFTEDNSYIHLFTNVLMYILHTYIHNKHIYIHTYIHTYFNCRQNRIHLQRSVRKAIEGVRSPVRAGWRHHSNRSESIWMHACTVCMYECMYLLCISSCSHSCLRSHNLIELLVILSAIANAKGTRFSLFVPERSFDVLVRIHT